MTKKLDILVVEDKEIHQKAAKALLADHNLTVVGGFDYALDVLQGVDNYSRKIKKKNFDVVLSDLMFPQGRGDMQGSEGKMLAYDPMPFGFPLAIIAARQGVKHIAVVTDMNHHSHPMAYTFDNLKDKQGYGTAVARIPIVGATVMFFDERDLPQAYALKNGKYSTEPTHQLMPLTEVQFPEDLETDYKKVADENAPGSFAYSRKDESYAILEGNDEFKFPAHTKNWKAALGVLLEK